MRLAETSINISPVGRYTNFHIIAQFLSNAIEEIIEIIVS